MKKLLILLSIVLLSLTSYGQSWKKGLIFDSPMSEWSNGYDQVSGIKGVQTDCYYTLDRQGNGRRWYDFDGSNDYVELPTQSTVKGLTAASVIIRYTPKLFADKAIYFESTANSGYTRFGLWQNANGTVDAAMRGSNTGSAFAITSATTLVLGREYSLSITVDTSTDIFIFYINNIEEGRNTSAKGAFTSDSPVDGCRLMRAVSDYLSGSISMCRIFNYALSPTQVVNYSKPEYPIEWVDQGATGTDVLSGWNFTSGWTTNSSTIIDATSFSSQAVNAGIYVANTLTTIGRYYKSVIAGNVTTGNLVVRDYSVIGSYVTLTGAFSNTTVFSAIGDDFFLANFVNGATSTITSMSLTQLGCVLNLNAEGMEYTTGVWADRTNSLSATVSGATVNIPPASNLSAMAFNGTSSKVNMGDVSSFTLPDYYHSVSFWCNINNLSSTISIISKRGGATTDCEYVYQIQLDGVISISYMSGGTVSNYSYWNGSAGAIVINTDYFIAFTYSNGTGQIFINGIKATTTKVSDGSGFSTFTNTTAPLIIGEQLDIQFVSGRLSKIKFWNRILSLEEITNLYNQGE